MRRAWPLFLLAALLWGGAVLRDAADRWIDTTRLPPLALDTSTEVVDRNGQLLRAFTVDDGRWRLAVEGDRVDPGYVAMLVNYEDRRFYDHPGSMPARWCAPWCRLRATAV